MEILLTPDCPHGEETVERVRRVVDGFSSTSAVEVVRVEGPEEAEALRFPGSPTVRVDGVDLEGGDAGPVSLECRAYGPGGRESLPPAWMIEAGVLRALAPTHLLFLCVANSARSQMAEAIARARAPSGVRVSSAGSEPGSVRPEAVRVLKELGIDAGGQRSSGVDEVQGPVDAVVTLCAEEVCPVWLEDAWRLHWALPDPAGVEDGGERLEAFRRVRDALLRRLSVLYPG